MRKRRAQPRGDILAHDPGEPSRGKVVRTWDERHRETPACPICKTKADTVWEGNTPVCLSPSCTFTRVKQRTDAMREHLARLNREKINENVVHFDGRVRRSQ